MSPFILGTSASSRIPSSVITGGTLTSDSTYYYRTFTSSGTLSVSNKDIVVDIMTLAAGGGGGNGSANYCAGGGAGGLIQSNSLSIAVGSYPVTIGAGGSAGSQGNNTQVSGLTYISYDYWGNPIVNNMTAIGGGYGAGSYYAVGGSGGSGGGSGPGNYSFASATSGQGNVGGAGSSANIGGSDSGAGGGGGAGGAGYDRTNPGGYRNGPGGGGEALQLSISGSAKYYAAGGVGAGFYYGDRVSGIGGGTSGYNYPQFQTISIDPNASVNTGSGGGGKGWAAGAGSGGSGIVIIRYLRSAVGG